MVDSGNPTDPDDPQALITDFEPPHDEAATADPAPLEEPTDEAPAVDEAPAGEEVVEKAPGAASRLLAAARPALAAGVSAAAGAAARGAGLAAAYPRAAIAAGLSVLVICGVLSMRPGKSPTVALSGPGAVSGKDAPKLGETPAAKPADDVTPPPSPDPVVKSSTPKAPPASPPVDEEPPLPDAVRLTGGDRIDLPASATPPAIDDLDVGDAPEPPDAAAIETPSGALFQLASADDKPEIELPEPVAPTSSAPAPAAVPDPAEPEDIAPAPSLGAAPAPVPVSTPAAAPTPAAPAVEPPPIVASPAPELATDPALPPEIESAKAPEAAPPTVPPAWTIPDSLRSSTSRLRPPRRRNPPARASSRGWGPPARCSGW